MIDCIATDHAPHSREEKEEPFEQAPMGVTGLETAFAALYTELVLPGVLELGLADRAHDRGRRPVRPAVPTLATGAPANFCLVDLEAELDGRRGGLREPLRELVLRGARAATAAC